MLIQHTVGMCKDCYRHVPAEVIIKDGKAILKKVCQIHGVQEAILDGDGDFYQLQNYNKRKPSSYWLDITNRCNLACPHCYQMPDNQSKDPSIDSLINQVIGWGDDGLPVSLVGAEPTTRKDLFELVETINALPTKTRDIMIVTNGVNLSKYEYAKMFQGIENLKWTFGLNHPDYNSRTIREQQNKGIENCVKLGLKIKNFTYTLGEIEQLEYALEEMHEFKNRGICDNTRIQLGVDIGRTPEDEHQEMYLSDLVKETYALCERKNWKITEREDLSNRTHYAVDIDGITVRLIKWCDVQTINLEETQSESWASLVPHKPMSPLLHQVILRDRFINNRQQLYDTIPLEYTKHESNTQDIISLRALL